MKQILFLLVLVSFNVFAASERIAPNTLIASSGLSSPSNANVDEDPDSPDGNWNVATGNNTNIAAEHGFPTPVGTLTVGADLQEFRIWVRQFDTGQSGLPHVHIELWEAGVLVRTSADTDVTGSGQIVSFTWNANEITNIADVEIEVVGTKSGGSPSSRNSVDIGAIEWNATVDASSTTKVMLIN